MKLALVLTGGGARGAYQAGAVKALFEMMKQGGCPPVNILTGISAGSINATYLASHSEDLYGAAQGLCELWESVHSSQVYRSDMISLGKIGLSWLTDVAMGSLYKKKLAESLLDNSPLRKFLSQAIPFEKISSNVAKGLLEGVSLSAFDYGDSKTVAFTQARQGVSMWDRRRRRSEAVELSVDHVMSSCAIPVVFPAHNMNGQHFGDGSLRNTAPVSPAIHLGAERIIVIGVRKPEHMFESLGATPHRPSVGRIFGLMLNSLFFDTTDADMDRLNHTNQILRQLQKESENKHHFRIIENFWLRPSRNLGELALESSKSLPKSVDYLLGGLGDRSESSELASYLLFEPAFTKRLVQLGYEDAMTQKDQLIEFLRI